MTDSKGKVAIVGSGLIGRSWAIVRTRLQSHTHTHIHKTHHYHHHAQLFSSNGYQVKLYDSIEGLAKQAKERIISELDVLEKRGIHFGNLDRVLNNNKPVNTLEEAVRDATYVQVSARSAGK